MTRLGFWVARALGDEERLMRLSVPPDAMVAELSGRRVALVGNARSLSERSEGEEIDSADLVIRLNAAPLPSPASHGMRTDWMAMSVPVEAKVIAQRRTLIGRAEQAALLEDGHDLGYEHIELPRQDRRHDIEPVRGAVGEPVLDQVRHLFGRARHGEVTTCAGKAVEQLAQRRPFPRHQGGDHLGTALRGLDRARVREVVHR